MIKPTDCIPSPKLLALRQMVADVATRETEAAGSQPPDDKAKRRKAEAEAILCKDTHKKPAEYCDGIMI